MELHIYKLPVFNKIFMKVPLPLVLSLPMLSGQATPMTIPEACFEKYSEPLV